MLLFCFTLSPLLWCCKGGQPPATTASYCRQRLKNNKRHGVSPSFSFPNLAITVAEVGKKLFDSPKGRLVARKESLEPSPAPLRLTVCSVLLLSVYVPPRIYSRCHVTYHYLHCVKNKCGPPTTSALPPKKAVSHLHKKKCHCWSSINHFALFTQW